MAGAGIETGSQRLRFAFPGAQHFRLDECIRATVAAVSAQSRGFLTLAAPATPPPPPTPPRATARRPQRLRQPAQPAGVPPTSRDRPADPATGRHLLGTAAQAAAELAEIGLSVSARALRGMIDRLPRP